MKILFVSAYFPPEIGAPANRVWELSRRWVGMGHTVEVLTGFPNHPTGIIHESYRKRFARLAARETVDGIRVTRTWLYPAPNRKAWQRILNYSSFGISAGLTGLWLERPDWVIATSPHLAAGAAGWWLSRRFRVPFCLEVRDLWPESLVASGIAKERSWLIRSLNRLAAFLYKRADLIVTVTPAMAQALRVRWQVPSDRLAVIEHGADPDRFKPMEPTGWPAELEGLDKQTVVSYIGTLGMAHGLATLLESAEQIAAADPTVTILLIGEGAEKEHLKETAEARGLRNVRFLPAQPPDKIPLFINRSAFCVALLKPAETFETVLPTKVLETLSCGRPLVLAAAGHARQVLEEARGGIAVDPGDSRALTKAILTLARDAGLRQRLGEAGRRYILHRFNLDRQAAAYLEHLERSQRRCRGRIS